MNQYHYIIYFYIDKEELWHNATLVVSFTDYPDPEDAGKYVHPDPCPQTNGTDS